MTRGLDKTGQMIAACRPSGIGAKKFASMSETDRVNLIKVQSRVPDACGSAIPSSPARGSFQVFMPKRVAPGGTRVNDGYEGRMAIRDLFTLEAMNEAARRAHIAKGRDPEDFEDIFDPGQVAIGRHYRDLVERCEAGGMKCSSLEARTSSSPGGGDYTTAIVNIGREIRLLRSRIGPGAAMVIRQVRPSKRGGSKATAIKDMDLVDSVCLGGASIRAVLERNGWSVNAKHSEKVRQALRAALDRMQGYPEPPLKKRS